jgi:hypothetical protein
MSIQDYLPNDNYKPIKPNPSLQQYDNYQIYSIACIDVSWKGNYSSDGIPVDIQFTRFIAWQSYNISPIRCDFNKIVDTYK